MSVTILVDSTCDLSDVLINQNNIKVLPLHVNFGEETYLDRENITVDELFNKVAKTRLSIKITSPILI